MHEGNFKVNDTVVCVNIDSMYWLGGYTIGKKYTLRPYSKNLNDISNPCIEDDYGQEWYINPCLYEKFKLCKRKKFFK